MDRVVADEKQTAVFVKAAMDRYRAKGVAQKKAEQLFSGALVSVAEALGMAKSASRTRIDGYKKKASAELSKITKR